MYVPDQLESAAASLDRGELTGDDLRQLAASVRRNGDGRRQSLLYLQSFSTDINKHLLGYTLIVNGRRVKGADNPDDWPYQSVAEAVRDGWRIISFPNMALLLDEEKSYGLGCEFVLEKMEYRDDGA